jgi:ABC-2 type transport system permease protein
MAGFFILVLLSNVLFFGFLAFTRLGGFYYDALSQVQSRASVWGQWDWFRASTRRKPKFAFHRGPMEKAVDCLPRLNRDTRALLVKDARMFWRDTAQWGQSALLFGLLGVYLINLRQFTSQLTNPFWVHLVSHLNLGACSLNLAMLTTRFVYPQFSLEGQRLWIIGMAPMGLSRVVRVKYWLACGITLSLTLGLAILSSCLLKLDWDRVVFFGAVIAVMAFTLNGLAVGLGVLYPNFRETNPSKIVSGFGGTFCFVLSFLYILGSIFILAYGSAESPRHPPSLALGLASISGFVLFSTLLGWLPLKLGFRQLRSFEY